MDPRALTIKFNDCINNRDVNGLEALMTDDHAFIDTAGRAIKGKSQSLEAWRGFFMSFPDYRNVFDDLVVGGDSVVVIGRSKCSDARLDGPALWIAKASGDKLAEWRVQEDTPTNRQTLGIIRLEGFRSEGRRSHSPSTRDAGAGASSSRAR